MTLSMRFVWNGAYVLMGELEIPAAPLDPFAPVSLDLSKSQIEVRAVRGSRLERVSRAPQKTLVLASDLAVSWQGPIEPARAALRELEALVARERPSASGIERALAGAPDDVAMIGLWGDDERWHEWEHGSVRRPPLEELGGPALAGSAAEYAASELSRLAGRAHHPLSKQASASFVGTRTSAALALHALCTAPPGPPLAALDVVVPHAREGRNALGKVDGVSVLFLTCDRRSGHEPRFVPQRAVQYASVGDASLMLVASFGEHGMTWESVAAQSPLGAAMDDDSIRARAWELPRVTRHSCICVGTFDDRGYRGAYTLTTSRDLEGAARDVTHLARGDDGVLSIVLTEQHRAELERIRVRELAPR